MAKNFTVAVHDPHSICLYDAETGGYEGIIYVTSGSIIGTPIINPKSVSVTYTENGSTYMSIFDLPSKGFNKKIYL
jgi:hypothetical protein